MKICGRGFSVSVQMRCVFLTDISLGVDDDNLEVVPRKHVRVLVNTYNHAGPLRLQSQHISNWKSFYTSWYMLLIQAKN